MKGMDVDVEMERRGGLRDTEEVWRQSLYGWKGGWTGLRRWKREVA